MKQVPPEPSANERKQPLLVFLQDSPKENSYWELEIERKDGVK